MFTEFRRMASLRRMEFGKEASDHRLRRKEDTEEAMPTAWNVYDNYPSIINYNKKKIKNIKFIEIT